MNIKKIKNIRIKTAKISVKTANNIVNIAEIILRTRFLTKIISNIAKKTSLTLRLLEHRLMILFSRSIL